VNGNYVGLNGKLLLQSVLNGDGSASDKLVIVQGTGSGKTTLGARRTFRAHQAIAHMSWHIS
jgi:type V secretory pathway adhesin AidA